MGDERSVSAEESAVRRFEGSRLRGTVSRVGIYLGIALAVFLLGLVPMWLRARENAGQRDAARRELRVSRMQNALASAAVDSARGDYEPARQSASDFFTALREEADVAGGDESALTARQRESLRPLLTQRDDVITLLARSDPASAPRLLEMHAAFRKAALAVPPEGGQREQQK